MADETRSIPIADIRIRNRVRRDLGDLAPLMDSLRRHGMMNPIIVTPKLDLIAGHRRLEAARRLGWSTVTCSVSEPEDAIASLEMEIEENTQRKGFSSDEMADALVRLDRLRRPSIWRRLWAFLRRLFRRRSR